MVSWIACGLRRQTREASAVNVFWFGVRHLAVLYPVFLRSELTPVNPLSPLDKPSDLAFDVCIPFHETDTQPHVQVFEAINVFLTKHRISNDTEAFSCPSQYLPWRRMPFECELSSGSSKYVLGRFFENPHEHLSPALECWVSDHYNGEDLMVGNRGTHCFRNNPVTALERL